MTSRPLQSDARERFAGVLLGTAVGDALGLPAENLSAQRIQRWWKGQWKMRFIFGRGMVSDDTEHTLMVAQALLSESNDAKKFQRILAWKLRWWFLALPGGVGLATARACLKLWFGFPAGRNAVKSAGSGPAMRSAIIGAYFSNSPELRKEFVLASSRLTHLGWQAETAALAVAECAALAIQNDSPPDSVIIILSLKNLSMEQEWQKLVSLMENSFKAGLSVREFARSLGLTRAVSGYSLHVVPVAIYAWLRHLNDFRTALISALNCGGDTDTVGAIVGALAGVAGGKGCIPAEWLDRIWEWPRSLSVMEQMAARLAEQRLTGKMGGPLFYFWPGQIFRNLIFFITVLAHGCRRLTPPY